LDSDVIFFLAISNKAYIVGMIVVSTWQTCYSSTAMLI